MESNPLSTAVQPSFIASRFVPDKQHSADIYAKYVLQSSFLSYLNLPLHQRHTWGDQEGQIPWVATQRGAVERPNPCHHPCPLPPLKPEMPSLSSEGFLCSSGGRNCHFCFLPLLCSQYSGASQVECLARQIRLWPCFAR